MLTPGSRGNGVELGWGFRTTCPLCPLALPYPLTLVGNED